MLADIIVDDIVFKSEFEQLTEAGWNTIYDVNLLHMFYMNKVAIVLILTSAARQRRQSLDHRAIRGVRLTVVY